MLGSYTLKSKYRREARAIKVRCNRYPLLTADRISAAKQDWGYKRRRAHKKPSVVYGALNAMS